MDTMSETTKDKIEDALVNVFQWFVYGGILIAIIHAWFLVAKILIIALGLL